MYKRTNKLYMLLVGLSLLLAACVPVQTPTIQSGAKATGGSQSTTGYPVTIENCGNTLTFTKAPERVLVTYQNVAEILVALGLTDKIVGVTYGQAYDPLPEMAEAVNGLNWLSARGKGSASKEVELSTQPDFVIAAYPTYDFDASLGVATQADFVAAGAPVYGISAECTAQVPDGTIESVYNDILNIGRIMGVEARAVALVQQIRDQIAAVQQQVAGQPLLPVAFYDAGEDPLGVYGSGLNADMIKLAGGENVFGDQAEVYLQVSKEAFAVTKPEIFAILDYEGSPAVPEEEARAEYLFTTFPNLPAAQNRRYVAVPGSAFAAGVRIPLAVEVMAKAFHPEAFATSPTIVTGGSQSTIGYPVTIENCGNTVTFTKEPERVVSLYPPNTEMLILLGLQDRLVGVGSYKDATYLLPETEAAYKALEPKKLSDNGVIAKEVLLTAHPDLVTDNQPDYFYDPKNGGASVEEIHNDGAQIYTLTAKCGGGKTNATMDDVYTDLENYGKIFGVAARATDIIAKMKATVADVQAKIKGQPLVKALVYDSGEGPLGIFGPGAWAYVLELAGGVNVFADLQESYAQVSVEEVATRDIDVFVVPDYGPDYTYAPSAQVRGEWLSKTFPNTAAAKNQRVVILPYQNINPSAQNAEGVLALAKGFYPALFK